MSFDNDHDELVLYADNDEPLYRQKKAFLENVGRKVERGTYDASKAPQLWLYWIKRAAQKYEKEFPGTKFSSAAKLAAAAEVAKREYRALMDGEYGPPPARKHTKAFPARSPGWHGQPLRHAKAAKKGHRRAARSPKFGELPHPTAAQRRKMRGPFHDAVERIALEKACYAATHPDYKLTRPNGDKCVMVLGPRGSMNVALHKMSTSQLKEYARKQGIHV